MKTFKGQYFSFDAIIASVIFILALVSLLSYWNSARTTLDFQNGDLTNEALRISEIALEPVNEPCPVNAQANAIQLSFGNAGKTAIKEIDFTCPNRNGVTSAQIKDGYQTPFEVSIKLSVPKDNSFGGPLWVGENLPADYSGTVAHVQRIVRIERISPNVDEPIISLGILDVYVYPKQQ